MNFGAFERGFGVCGEVRSGLLSDGEATDKQEIIKAGMARAPHETAVQLYFSNKEYRITVPYRIRFTSPCP
jgi:hypothetical protein